MLGQGLLTYNRRERSDGLDWVVECRSGGGESTLRREMVSVEHWKIHREGKDSINVFR